MMTKRTAKRAKASDPAVSAYIDARPHAVRNTLTAVRGAIRRALPDAQETISYKIPAYRVEGRIALYFAAWDEHYALYPVNREIVEALPARLFLSSSGKGTVRFSYADKVPVKLIARIARLRAKHIGERKKGASRRAPANRTESRPDVRRSRHRRKRARARPGGRTTRGNYTSGSASATRS